MSVMEVATTATATETSTEPVEAGADAAADSTPHAETQASENGAAEALPQRNLVVADPDRGAGPLTPGSAVIEKRIGPQLDPSGAGP
jgi:hypothetical protein